MTSLVSNIGTCNNMMYDLHCHVCHDLLLFLLIERLYFSSFIILGHVSWYLLQAVLLVHLSSPRATCILLTSCIWRASDYLVCFSMRRLKSDLSIYISCVLFKLSTDKKNKMPSLCWNIAAVTHAIHQVSTTHLVVSLSFLFLLQFS